MQTHENLETKKLTKQDYNKLYYEKNKTKWDKKKKLSAKANVFRLFTLPIPSPSPIGGPSHSWASFFRWLEFAVLASLAIAITLFLIKEAAAFYLESQESPTSAYFKAALVEGVAILFSFSRGNSVFLRHVQRIVAVLLCGLTLFVMTGTCVKTAVGDTTKIQSMRQTLQQLESELVQKEQLREKLLKNSWLGAARRYERGMDQIRARIRQVRQEINTLRSPMVIFNSLGILISFRLLLVITNLICVHRVVEHLESLSEPERDQKEKGKVLNFLN